MTTFPAAVFAAAHRNPLAGGCRAVPAVRCSEIRCVSSSERSWASITTSSVPTVVPMYGKEINSGKGAAMANLEHPIDKAMMDLAALQRDIANPFSGDGRVTAAEHGILVRFEQERKRIGRARAFERATQLAMKQEGRFSDYTNEQFRLAGVRITPVEPDDAA